MRDDAVVIVCCCTAIFDVVVVDLMFGVDRVGRSSSSTGRRRGDNRHGLHGRKRSGFLFARLIISDLYVMLIGVSTDVGRVAGRQLADHVLVAGQPGDERVAGQRVVFRRVVVALVDAGCVGFLLVDLGCKSEEYTQLKTFFLNQ